MKTLCKWALLVVLALYANNIKSQVVVNDPTLTTTTIENWRQSLDNSIKQFNQIKEQSEILKEGIDKYKKVNQTIKNYKRVESLIDRQVKLINFLSTALSEAKQQSFSIPAYESYYRRLNSILNQSKDNVVELTDVLIDSKLNLSDFERLQIIDKCDQKSAQLLSTAVNEKKKYDNLNSTLKELDKLKSK